MIILLKQNVISGVHLFVCSLGLSELLLCNLCLLSLFSALFSRCYGVERYLWQCQQAWSGSNFVVFIDLILFFLVIFFFYCFFLFFFFFKIRADVQDADKETIPNKHRKQYKYQVSFGYPSNFQKQKLVMIFVQKVETLIKKFIGLFYVFEKFILNNFKI